MKKKFNRILKERWRDYLSESNLKIYSSMDKIYEIGNICLLNSIDFYKLEK